ncbi:Uncharacterized protein LW93_14380 [Fusarium fujikuroi]|nr:Uncharacterized protein LW93_14380 [Fusarium fujikuroi]
MAIQLGSSELYTIAWIAALPIERAAATALLDETHDEPDGFIQHEIDNNSYSWGRVGEHNVVIASLQAGVYGTISAATTVSDLISSLPHIRFGLLVGIGGGITKPGEDQDIRLGDVVVSQPHGTTGGVMQYDFGKAKAGGIWEQKGSLNKPPPVLLHALASLQARHEMAPSKIPDLLETMWSANNRFMTKGKRNYTHPGAANDRLYESEYSHVGGATCSKCDSAWEVEREERDSTDPEIHYGIIASGDSLIKDAATRDKLRERQEFLCVEMEAAGLMDKFPCLVIRGICDYADSHKNDQWQRYAAATAAAFTVELLEHVPAKQVHATRKVIEAVKSIEDKIHNLSVSVHNIDSNIVFDRLPDAEGARYDSHPGGHNSMCLVNTRVDLLKELSNWIEDDTSKPILWLNGMAGTGKSTIARTIAKSRAETGDLGASFFFKRGEADRESLVKFIPTLARQLARAVPGYAQIVKERLDSDPGIVSQAVAKQFAELIEAPLKELAKTPLAIVIDALDECEKEDEIKYLIRILLSATSIQQNIRILITSRPDLPIRLGFANADGSYQALVLHDMPVTTIKHDIMTFLIQEFERIRFDFNSAVPIELGLPRHWPGGDVINKLTEMSVPLFIFAATVCRFVSSRKVGDPSEQLSKYFQLSENNYGSHLDRIYGPVLRSTVTDVSEEERRQIIEQTCHIVGGIVILANPLSVMAMSTLLELPVRVVHSRLNALHSILNIPRDLHEPVRLLHISLRDYLTDNNQNQNQTNEFWVNERLIHLGLFKSCLRIMDKNLKEDICGLGWPGTQRNSIPSEVIASCISDELQYACRHWAYHFQKIETPLLNLDEALEFLQKHLLHWLEALSLIGRFRESVQVIKILQTVVKIEQNILPYSLLREIQSFIQMNSTIIDQHPLQLYSSLIFSIPSGSQLDQTCPTSLPPWLLHGPEPSKASDQAQYILDGQPATSEYFSFSSDNSLLGTCDDDAQIRIWSLETGECVRTLNILELRRLKFFRLSHDGMWVAATSQRYLDVRSSDWETEPANDDEISDTNSLEEDNDIMSDADNSDTRGQGEESDGRSGEEEAYVWSDWSMPPRDKSLRYFLKIWHVDTGKPIGPLTVQWTRQPFLFSPDSRLLVSITDTGCAIVMALDTAESANENCLTGSEQIIRPTFWCPYHNHRMGEVPPRYFMEFSPDSSLLTIMSTCTDKLSGEGVSFFDGRFKAWDLTTGECAISLQTRICCPFISPGSAVFVSPEERWIFSVRHMNVTFIALDTFSVTRELTFTGPVHDVVISPNSQFLLVLCQASEREYSTNLDPHQRREFLLSKFSIDSGDQLASIKLVTIYPRILAVSSDAKFVVLQTMKGALAILTGTGELLYQFELRFDEQYASLAKKDSVLVTYDCHDFTLRDASTGLLLRKLWINTSFVPVRFDFDATTEEFHTNLGTLALRKVFKDETREIRLDENLTGLGISHDGSWLLWKHHKVFWLWPELRPEHNSRHRVGYIEVSGSTVIIGTTTGRVLFFKFDIQSLLGMQ